MKVNIGQKQRGTLLEGGNGKDLRSDVFWILHVDTNVIGHFCDLGLASTQVISRAEALKGYQSKEYLH